MRLPELLRMLRRNARTDVTLTRDSLASFWAGGLKQQIWANRTVLSLPSGFFSIWFPVRGRIQAQQGMRFLQLQRSAASKGRRGACWLTS